MCARCEETHEHKERNKREGKEGSEEEENKLPTQPIISKTDKNILGWLNVLCFINLIVQEPVRQSGPTPFRSVLSQEGRRKFKAIHLFQELAGELLFDHLNPRHHYPPLSSWPLSLLVAAATWAWLAHCWEGKSVEPGSKQNVKRRRKKIVDMNISKGCTCLEAWDNSWQPQRPYYNPMRSSWTAEWLFSFSLSMQLLNPVLFASDSIGSL